MRAVCRTTTVATLGLAGLLALAGCGEQASIETYTVPKDPPAMTATEPETPAPQAPAAPTDRPRVTWTLPQSWHEHTQPSPMRVATLHTGSDGQRPVEVAVTAFPGNVGGILANINRWREQIGLPPVTEDSLRQHVEPIQFDSFMGLVTDMTAPPAASSASTGGEGEADISQRIIAVILFDQGTGWTWFIKATDQAEKLSAHKQDILAFARSFRVERPQDPQANGMTAGPTPGAAARAQWQAPEHWQADTNPASVIEAAYNIENEAGRARLTVTVLGGDVGGMLANINRWRGQVNLPPIGDLTQQPVKPLQLEGWSGGLIELTAPPPDASASPEAPEADQTSTPRPAMLVLLIPQPETGQTWFFKLMGEVQAVEAEKSAFMQFVQSIRFEEAQP